MHSIDLLKDISLGIIFSVAVAHIARLFRQPLILGYVLGGALLGPTLGFGLISNEQSIEFISEIGLIFLLFIIGLEINIRELMKMGKSIIVTGFFQFAACAALGFAVFKLLGMFPAAHDRLYMSIGLALSSTLVVVKLLNDKFETFTLAGKLTISVLVLQDIWAIIFMAFQPNLQSPQLGGLLLSSVKGFALIGAAFLISRHLLGRIFSSAAKSPELVLLTAIGWCFLLCSASQAAGLSKEMGALIAGMSIAAFPYGADIIGKVGGIRDFFVTLFFVALGLKIPVLSFSDIGLAIALSIFVLLSRLLSVPFVTVKMKLGLRAGIISALNLSQISEFSLVIMALGVGYGHLSASAQPIMLTAMLIAAIMGTYIISYNDKIAKVIITALGYGKHEEKSTGDSEDTQVKRDIVVLGCFREGRFFLDAVEKFAPELKERILVVDFNHSLKEGLAKRGYAWEYGDLSNHETLAHIGIDQASIVICAIPDVFLKGTTNQRLLTQMKHLAPKAKKIMLAEDSASAEALLGAGADKAIISGQVSGKAIFENLQTLI